MGMYLLSAEYSHVWKFFVSRKFEKWKKDLISFSLGYGIQAMFSSQSVCTETKLMFLVTECFSSSSATSV